MKTHMHKVLYTAQFMIDKVQIASPSYQIQRSDAAAQEDPVCDIISRTPLTTSTLRTEGVCLQSAHFKTARQTVGMGFLQPGITDPPCCTFEKRWLQNMYKAKAS